MNTQNVRRLVSAAALLVTALLLLPSASFAQASISGVVKDASGAVLPGVTVEASSPDLIEKVRSTTTDSSGQFRIVDLRAGTYSVSFSLTGFSTIKREGIVLSGSFTAVVNADLKVGALEETVVVTGESPIVDTQNIRRQSTMDNEIINAIPAARSYGGLMTLMPNTVVQGGAASNAQVAPQMVVFGGAGGRTNEGRLQVDGISVGTAFNGAGVSAYVADVNNAQEVVLTSSGGLGEAEVGGPVLNIIPKEGGNNLSGQLYASQVTKGMIGSNYTQDLKDRGLTTPGAYTSLFDYNVGVFGPIVKERLWYALQIRNEGYEQTIPGMFANANANDPTKWTYVPDKSRPAYGAAAFQTSALRLTGQITQKNKITGLWDEQRPCEGAALTNDADACRHSDSDQIICAGASPTPACSATAAPETGTYRHFGQRIQQVRWTSPQTNRLLLEAGMGTYMSRWGGTPMPGQDPNLIRVVDQCTTGAGVAGQPCEHGIANITYRSPNWSSNWTVVLNFKASASYIMGAHNLKIGYQGASLQDNQKSFSNDQLLTYRFNNGVPNQITETINAYDKHQVVTPTSFYGQDSWTFRRFTLQGALRYDHATSHFPDQTVGPQRFFPVATTYTARDGVSYNDLTPRGGVAVDVFGNGKTSVKFNFGRYLEAAQNAGLFIAGNPTNQLSTTTTRTWDDRTGKGINGDYIPQCDLLNPAINGECGASSNPNFGTQVIASTIDPKLVSGWGVRTGDWQWGVAVQQQLAPRVSAEVTYQRRWLVNFNATDNLNQAPVDYDQFSVKIPVDSRLPNGGGGTVDGVYNVTQAASTRLQNNLVTLASNYGSGQHQTSDSLSLNLTARPHFGLTVQGGFNYAKINFDRCEVRALVPEMNDAVPGITGINPTNPWCAYATDLFRATALASYVVPKIDVQLATTFRSDQGAPLSANFTASPSDTTLGRAFAGGSTTITTNLIQPGSLYGDRVNQLDLRVAKLLRFGKTRTSLGVDIYNIMNSNPVLTYNEAYSPTTTTWLRPTSVLQPRFAKVSAQFNF
jgi:hypothetical protein